MIMTEISLQYDLKNLPPRLQVALTTEVRLDEPVKKIFAKTAYWDRRSEFGINVTCFNDNFSNTYPHKYHLKVQPS